MKAHKTPEISDADVARLTLDLFLEFGAFAAAEKIGVDFKELVAMALGLPPSARALALAKSYFGRGPRHG